jgi:hypothetical protein
MTVGCDCFRHNLENRFIGFESRREGMAGWEMIGTGSALTVPGGRGSYNIYELFGSREGGEGNSADEADEEEREGTIDGGEG